MKKVILLAATMLASMAYAQDPIAVYGNDGVEITNGYEFVTSDLFTLAEPEKGYLSIVAENISDETINLKLKVTAMSNADGNEGAVQICFDVCYYAVTPDFSAPTSVGGVVLEPNEHNPVTDHFANGYAGDDTAQPVTYDLAIVQVDAEGNELATLRTFKFIYDATAGVNDLAGLQNLGIVIKNTVVNNVLELDAAHTANLQVFDITGKLLKEAAITEGVQAIDLSTLNTAVYIAKFTTEENKTSQIRIVKN